MAYAHSRGVIHRDLKPKNVMIGPFDETLVVNWGLARLFGRGGAEGSAQDRLLPVPGDGEGDASSSFGPVGTIGYLSPEQARGDPERPGPRSDVYSLGAALYCLFCGRPPFEGEDIGAILDAVQAGQFPRPSRLDPALDPALGAVCLKAMALRPGERYASARLLAEDVERWMADEPVSAWREPRSRRLARWLGRHRTGVAGAVAAVLAGVMGLASVLAVKSGANARLSESLQREREANAALNAANSELKASKAAVQARYDLALAAIQSLHSGASEDFLLKEERFKEFRDGLLKSASGFYVKLVALLDKETDAASRRELADSKFELAKLTDKVGRREDALEAHQAVLVVRDALAAEPGADTGVKVDVGRSLTEVALLLYSTGKTDEALEAYRRSESLLAGLASSDPAARSALAACRRRMAALLAYKGETAEALEAFERARSDQEELAAARGASNDARRDLAETFNNIGTLLWYKGRLSGAESEHRTALAIQRKLADDDPTVTSFGKDLAVTRYALGLLLSATGRPSEAEAELRMAMATMERLADENPADIDFRIVLAMIRAQLGLLLMQVGHPGKAEVECRAAVASEQKLVGENPAVIFYRDRLVEALTCLGDVLRARGRAAAARDLYQRAITLGGPRVEQDPRDTQQGYYLVCAMRRHGLALGDFGDRAGAAAEARRALEMCAGLPLRSIWDLFETACCHAALAGLAGRAGSGVSASEGEEHAARAMERLGRAVTVGYRNANELRIETALDPLRSRDDFRLLLMDVAFPSGPFAPADRRE